MEKFEGLTATRSHGEIAGGKPKTSGKALLSAGSLLGAAAASSCCALPLALFSLGASGAWIGNLTALAPYQPIVLAITAAFLGAGFWSLYRRPKTSECDVDGFCGSTRAERLMKVVLWTSSVLVAAAIAFNFLAPLFLLS